MYAQEAAARAARGDAAAVAASNCDQAHDQLAVLTGRLPADFTPVQFELDRLVLPADLPLGVPSELVERRPDVRAAEAQLHAATAAGRRGRSPICCRNSRITGDIGSYRDLLVHDLFKPGTGFWSIGANATQTLFSGGTLLHRKRAADAALDQAGAEYTLRGADGISKRRRRPACARLRMRDALEAAGRAERCAEEPRGGDGSN